MKSRSSMVVKRLIVSVVQTLDRLVWVRYSKLGEEVQEMEFLQSLHDILHNIAHRGYIFHVNGA